MSIDKIFRVNVRRLNLREQPGTDSRVLVGLDAGQAVARMDDVDRGGWWYVFADTPGEGIYLGHVYAEFLKPAYSDAGTGSVVISPVVQVPPGEGDAPVADPGEPDMEGRDPGSGMGPVIDTSEDDPAGPLPAQLPDGWNPVVPAERRYKSVNQKSRPGSERIDRVVIHITGTDNFEVIRKRFTEKSRNPASAHYLVMPDGLIHQFVPETMVSYHSGIVSYVDALYRIGDGGWRRFKRYFSDFDTRNQYPKDAIFLDINGHVVPPSQRKEEARLVMRADRAEWSAYAYFDRRWGRRPMPVGYTPGYSPNDHSIGIEVFGWGSPQPNPEAYTAQMYSALGALVGDICRRHQLPISHEAICGHEDVNPVERWGWDPNKGFDWDKLFTLARQSAAAVA